MGWVRGALVVTALGVLAGCGGGNGASNSDDDATEATDSDDDAATVEQVASVVAETRSNLLDALAGYDDARFSQITLSRCDPLLCQLPILTLTTVSKTLEITLGSIDEDKPENQLFIGEIPEELEGLVDDTLAALASTISAGEAYTACVMADVTQGSCGLFDLNFATADLEGELSAWDPYI